MNKEELRKLIESGSDVSDLDVSGITDMSKLFKDMTKFNQDISNWDVSNVTSMQGMFEYCRLFNQPLDKWDVSNVTDMSYMFTSCTKFNQDINSWDVANVENFTNMFTVASKFNHKLYNWHIHEHANMQYMFDDSSVTCKHNVGDNYRTIYAMKFKNLTAYFGGCFFGTFEEYVDAVNENYPLEQADSYNSRLSELKEIINVG